MNTVNATEINLSDPKKAICELEDKILERIGSDYRLKEIKKPFAVLELDRSNVLLGSTKEIVGKVAYNYSVKSALQEVVGALIGNMYVEVELKVAEAEFQAIKKRIDGKTAEQKKEAEILADIDAQRKEGKCNLIPFPLKENKVRSDLTIERHALFAANTFKGSFRVHERKIRDRETGSRSILRVEIGDPTGRVSGVLKQKHQEAFYKLSQLWSKQNYKIEKNKESELTGFVKLSVYDLVHLLRGNDGGRNYKDVFQLIDEMSTIRINIEKTNSQDGTCEVQNFTLLSYRWYARGFNKKTLMPSADGESNVSINFSDFVTDSFLRKNIKSLMLDPYLLLKDQGRKGVSQLLYTMLDYELSTKEKFNISLVNLCERLGLTTYGFKSKRKQVLQGSIDAVNGSVILDGKHKVDCYITESEDRKDWILIARRALP